MPGCSTSYGTQQIRRWRIVPETQSFHEMWNGGDLSHGWCSTPLVQMSGRVLGVRPTSPGFKTLVIRPELCDLTWARGSVPTPQGDVAVSWKLSEDRLLLDVSLPQALQPRSSRRWTVREPAVRCGRPAPWDRGFVWRPASIR